MSNLISQGLLEDKLKLQSGNITKASAIFPLFDLNKTDLILNFQNYWKWKKDIDVNYLIRIRSNKGVLILQTKNTKPVAVNSISIKDLLIQNKIKSEISSEGTAEIEIISLENLVFPFPAIIGMYKSKNNMISIVHAAGRSLENVFENEKDFSETNFYMSDDKKYKPFIHFFNGSSGSLKDIKLEIKSTNLEKTKEIIIPDLNLPYESKILFIDNKILNEINENNKNDCNDGLGYIIKVSGKTTSIFPRFICGNFDYENDHYCVTHTYREINNDFDVIHNVNSEKVSFAVLPLAKDFLKLNMFIYPTTSSQPNSVTLKSISIKDLKPIEVLKDKDLSIKNNKVFSRLIEKENLPGLLITAEPSKLSKELPARIPVNLMYGLNGSMKTLATDIAFQMTTHFSMTRKSHWHNGIITKGYCHLISGSGIVNESLIKSQSTSLDFFFYLNVNDNEEDFHKRFILNENEAKLFTIELDEMFKEAKFDLNKIHSYSWRINVLKGNLGPLICLSYNREIGCIYGDHSF